MTLSDAELVEEIKKVKVEKSKPKNWDRYVERRYMDWSISREGHDLMVEFFKTIGPGSVNIDSWHGMKRINGAAKEAGFILMKNKRSGGYGIFPKKIDPETLSFSFNPELLDMDDAEKVDENEKTSMGKPA